MKKTLALLLGALTLSGCAIQTSRHTHVQRDFWDPPANNVITVVNNSTYVLTIVEDGRTVREDLEPGGVFTDEVYTSFEGSALTLVALAAKNDKHVGVVSRVFPLYRYGRHAEVWTITHVRPLGGAPASSGIE